MTDVSFSIGQNYENTVCSLHEPVDAVRKPPASLMRRYICCFYAVAHHHCVPFQAHLLLFVYLCVVRFLISPGINQLRIIWTVGASAHAAQIMMDRIEKVRRGK